jgi:hypothetical protein
VEIDNGLALEGLLLEEGDHAVNVSVVRHALIIPPPAPEPKVKLALTSTLAEGSIGA